MNLALTLALLTPVHAEPAARKLELHVVPVPIKSYRLLSMSMDDDGFIWAGSVHRAIHRYDPRTGKVETVPVPYTIPAANSCLCVANKVYILGQTYSKLVLYDRTTKQFSEKSYPSAKVNVWYGNASSDGKHLYLFDRAGSGVVKWDTQRDTGKVIAWPYKQPFPAGGSGVPGDNGMWCRVWDFAGGKYRPLGIARLDTDKEQFTDWYDFPKTDDGLDPYGEPGQTLFMPYTLEGKVVPFDVKQRRWCKFLSVPEHGKRFAFMGGPVPHNGRYYFSLSTYNGTDVGCDGKPYHFLNSTLEFDPASRRFEFLTLEAKDAYHQIAYMLSAGGHFFATGTNIQTGPSTLDRDRAGEVVFWQTQPQRK